MLFLVDADVLITANNTYYPVERVPEFWEWIAHQASLGHVKLPLEIFGEVLPGRKNDDPLPNWMKAHRDVILLDEVVEPLLVQRVVNEGYAAILGMMRLKRLGATPF